MNGTTFCRYTSGSESVRTPGPLVTPDFVTRRYGRAWIQAARLNAPEANSTARRGARRGPLQFHHGPPGSQCLSGPFASRARRNCTTAIPEHLK